MRRRDPGAGACSGPVASMRWLDVWTARPSPQGRAVSIKRRLVHPTAHSCALLRHGAVQRRTCHGCAPGAANRASRNRCHSLAIAWRQADLFRCCAHRSLVRMAHRRRPRIDSGTPARARPDRLMLFDRWNRRRSHPSHQMAARVAHQVMCPVVPPVAFPVVHLAVLPVTHCRCQRPDVRPRRPPMPAATCRGACSRACAGRWTHDPSASPRPQAMRGSGSPELPCSWLRRSRAPPPSPQW